MFTAFNRRLLVPCSWSITYWREMAHNLKSPLGKDSEISFCCLYKRKSVVSLTWWSYKMKLSIKLPASPFVYQQVLLKWNHASSWRFSETSSICKIRQHWSSTDHLLVPYEYVLSLPSPLPEVKELCPYVFTVQVTSTNQIYLECFPDTVPFPDMILSTQIQQLIRNHPCPVRAGSLMLSSQ